MTNDLDYYPAMKSSGSPWLGQIPDHWIVKRAKQFYVEVDERSITGDEEMLSVSHITGVTSRKEKNVTMFVAETNVGHKLCRPNDLVINTMWAWMSALGVARLGGIVSPAYGVYRPLETSALRPEYADLLLHTEAYRAEYVTRSTGVNSSRMRLYPDSFLSIPIICPPVEEQLAIIRFLRFIDDRVRRFISTKRQVMRLLEEQKRAITRRALSQGLGVGTALKATGSQWLEEVPSHWELSRVKTEFQCLNSRRIPLSSTQRGAMIARTYDYYGASGAIDKVEDYIFDDDLLLIAEDGANLISRNLPLAIIATGRFWVNNHAHILKPKRGNLEFLAALMESVDFRPWISGAAQPKLTQDRLMSIRIPVPPPNEQGEIMAAVKSETGSLQASIDRMSSEIVLLIEYRDRLIEDVVTGKRDVRNISSTLADLDGSLWLTANVSLDDEDQELELDADDLAEEQVGV